MKPNSFTHPKIMTKDARGDANGYLIPLYNIHETPIEPEQHPKQVYLTVITPGKVKGPHLHKKRWGLFTCIRGNVKIVVKTQDGYQEFFSGEDYKFATVQVPAGFPAALHNVGENEAYVLNMPSPAWREDEQDEHPTQFDGYEFK